MSPYLIALCALLALFGYWQWNERGAESARADRAEAALKTGKANEKIVTLYVERKVEVIRRVPVIRERLVDRLCHDTELPGAGHPDAAAGAQAGDGIAGPLAGEIGACLAETEQLKALQAVLRPQLAGG